MTVTDRTQHRSRPGPPGPAEPAGSLSSRHRAAVDAPPSRPPLARATPPATGGGTAVPGLARPDPDGALKGPDLGREDAATSHRATPPPSSGVVVALTSLAAPPGEARRRQNHLNQSTPPRTRKAPRLPAKHAGRGKAAAAGTARALPGGLHRLRRRGKRREGGSWALGFGRPDAARGEQSGTRRTVFFFPYFCLQLMSVGLGRTKRTN
jgi:hypothetical protein